MVLLRSKLASSRNSSSSLISAFISFSSQFPHGSIPAFDLVKLTNGTNNDAAPGPFVPVGSTVTFTYIVTNPGNVPLSGVTVRDNAFSRLGTVAIFDNSHRTTNTIRP